jgi:lipoate-protein ligase A
VSAAPRFRVIDTGLRGGCANVAFDQAMIDLHSTGEIPDTIRFIRFPSTVLIGRHQALGHEVDTEYCAARNVGIARRITGGGAIYFDPDQLGWALVFNRATLGIASLADLAREICEAAASGLSSLGIEACYRPRNDIEVDGRKLSGTGGFFDGDTLFYQGTVLVDMDYADMTSALRVPAAKLAKHGLESPAARVVTLRELLGDSVPSLDEVKQALLDGFQRHLGIETFAAEVSAIEEATATRIHAEETGTDEFIRSIDDPAAPADIRSGTHTSRGGSITAHVRLEGPRQDRIREVLFTGDFFVTPPRVIMDLESVLRSILLTDCAAEIAAFLERTNMGTLSVNAADFAAAIEAAVAGS